MSNRVGSLLLKLAVLSMSVVTAAGAGCDGDAGGKPGNPPPSATCVVPASPVDTSSPTTVVGDGSDGLFGGDTGVNLQNTIVANNPRGTLDSTTNCAKPHGSSGPNLQFAAARSVLPPSPRRIPRLARCRTTGDRPRPCFRGRAARRLARAPAARRSISVATRARARAPSGRSRLAELVPPLVDSWLVERPD